MNASRLLSAALVAALGLLPVAPPEHVHEAEEHGRVHVVVHRHSTPHGIFGQHGATHSSAFDDDDGPVLTLSTDYNVPAAPVLASPVQSAWRWIEPPAPKLTPRPPATVEILIHGPPRAPTALRAPPSSPTV